MGTPLTGSSVASTYTGLLKNSDNSTVGASLKAISDGSGNDSALQISNVAVNTTNDFSVATNKLTVASASGNTAIAGTLAVTGATNLSSLATSGAATIGGALNVTGATTLTGNLTVPGNLAVTGTSTLTGATAVTGTLGVTGVSTLSSVGVTGAATVGTTLGVTGNATLSSNLAVDGNTTLGNAGADTVTINASTVTMPNVSTVAVEFANDKVLISDASSLGELKIVTVSSLTPQCVSTIFTGISNFTSTNSGSGVEITSLNASITPRSTGSKVLVTIVINYSTDIGNVTYAAAFRITRNGTEIGSNAIGSSLYGIAPMSGLSDFTGSDSFLSNQTIQFLDSPSSSSSVAYKLHLFTTTGGGITPNIYLNRTRADITAGINSAFNARASSSMTLQEYLA
jgi:hypothetical protein